MILDISFQSYFENMFSKINLKKTRFKKANRLSLRTNKFFLFILRARDREEKKD